jgi:HAD superfamily hydrolase (TIGR01484 family)
MRPVAAITADEARGLRALFTDIDGTLTDRDGRIGSRVFAAMEAAGDAGLAVVPITGRPAGWADMIARTWPVDGVVGENGGLAFRREVGPDGQDRMRRTWTQDDATRAANRATMDRLAMEVLAAHPGAALASDQRYRVFDIAIDFCEDVPRLPDAEIDAIVARFAAAGCAVKVSNIHVNAWIGAFDKASMCRRYCADRWGWDLDGPDRERAVFFGDSPNDGPLFRLFPFGVGVANVRHMADRMPCLPRFVTDGDGGAGFVEAVDLLLRLRGAR